MRHQRHVRANQLHGGVDGLDLRFVLNAGPSIRQHTDQGGVVRVDVVLCRGDLDGVGGKTEIARADANAAEIALGSDEVSCSRGRFHGSIGVTDGIVVHHEKRRDHDGEEEHADGRNRGHLGRQIHFGKKRHYGLTNELITIQDH